MLFSFVKYTILVSLFSVWLMGLPLHFRGDYSKALAEARDSHKLLLVLLTDVGDKKTQTLLKTTLTDRKVTKWISKHCVIVIVIKNQQNYPIEMLYTTKSPALFLLSSDDEIIRSDPLFGVFNAKTFQETIENAVRN